MIRASATYCPNCAALLSFEAGAAEVVCTYCEAALMLDVGRVTHHRASAPRSSAGRPGDETLVAPIAQPDPSLFVRDAARFRTRIIEQVTPANGGAPTDLYRTIELEDDRFAIVSLRCVDDQSVPLPMDLEPAWEVLAESLGDDGDPGLAANLALEELAQDPTFQKLECVIAVLDPARTTAQVYSAGCRDGAYWVSTEEARPIIAGTNHQALERADLAKTGSHFENGKTIQLAAQDLLVVASFGYLNDKGIGSGFPRLLTETLREHLGEDSLRVVTLIKNEFWGQREKGRKADAPLAGDLRIAAVGARLAEIDEADSESKPTVDLHTSRHYQVAMQRAALPEGGGDPVDGVRFWPLQGDRFAVLWMHRGRGLYELELDTAQAAVTEILDRTEHGDFDNPRAAGRHALARLAADHGDRADGIRMVVMHLSDEHRVVKFFAHGCKAPITLGTRGLRPEHEQQQFDGGGQCTVHGQSRLFFPGALEYEGNVIRADAFAERWSGGKSSHLYEALRLHWRTRKSDKALVKIIRAAAADSSLESAQGLLLVTGV